MSLVAAPYPVRRAATPGLEKGPVRGRHAFDANSNDPPTRARLQFQVAGVGTVAKGMGVVRDALDPDYKQPN